MLPVNVEYENFSVEKLTKIVRTNHIFCGLHAIHYPGSTTPKD